MIDIRTPSVEEKKSNEADVKVTAGSFGNPGKIDRRTGTSRQERVKMAHACRGGPPGVPHGEIQEIPPFENGIDWDRVVEIIRFGIGVLMFLCALVAMFTHAQTGDNKPAVIFQMSQRSFPTYARRDSIWTQMQDV
eukprot:332968_1